MREGSSFTMAMNAAAPKRGFLCGGLSDGKNANNLLAPPYLGEAPMRGTVVTIQFSWFRYEPDRFMCVSSEPFL
jgi:hypothetical protein